MLLDMQAARRKGPAAVVGEGAGPAQAVVKDQGAPTTPAAGALRCWPSDADVAGCLPSARARLERARKA